MRLPEITPDRTTQPRRYLGVFIDGLSRTISGGASAKVVTAIQLTTARNMGDGAGYQVDRTEFTWRDFELWKHCTLE
jgi:hypothetical protein